MTEKIGVHDTLAIEGRTPQEVLWTEDKHCLSVFAMNTEYEEETSILHCSVMRRYWNNNISGMNTFKKNTEKTRKCYYHCHKPFTNIYQRQFQVPKHDEDLEVQKAGCILDFPGGD